MNHHNCPQADSKEIDEPKETTSLKSFPSKPWRKKPWEGEKEYSSQLDLKQTIQIAKRNFTRDQKLLITPSSKIIIDKNARHQECVRDKSNFLIFRSFLLLENSVVSFMPYNIRSSRKQELRNNTSKQHVCIYSLLYFCSKIYARNLIAKQRGLNFIVFFFYLIY